MKLMIKPMVAALLAIVACCNILNIKVVEARQKPYLDADEIIATAKSLESAEVLSDNVSNELVQQRTLLQYNFVRPSKSSFAAEQFDKIIRTANEYKFKAYEFVRDNAKATKKNWFTNIKKLIGPIGSMKSIAKKYSFLQDINERYEAEAVNGLLTNDDVDCDVNKFKISELSKIYFVLQTDIKYLVIGDQQILNRAIYEQLKADKFESSHNFHEAHQLNERQKSLLMKYYIEHTNLLVTNVGDSVDHFYNPGEFIMGRLMESCQTVNQYASLWQMLDSNRIETCSKSRSEQNGKQFVDYYTISKYEDILELCHGLFDAL